MPDDGLHSEFQVATEALDIECPTLSEASSLSKAFVSSALESLQNEIVPDEPLDVLAFGSIARCEMSPESDFDWLVIAHGLPNDVKKTTDLMNATERLKDQNALRSPGATGMFGTIVSAAEFTERIGLEQDTNLSHSRRILILQESVSIYRPELHAKLVKAILQRYLADYTTIKSGVPRFLLNDVLRYWRTLVVDYQAKRWHREQTPWGLRYLKLILSRKLAFAGTLASLFLCEEATVDYLYEQFSMPALARLAQLHKHLEPEFHEHLRMVLLTAEDFAAILGTAEFRAEANSIAGRTDIQEGSRFAEWQDRARRMQEALECIFFDSVRLRRHSRKYLSF